MTSKADRSRESNRWASIAIPILCACVALLLRLPYPPERQAADPWVRGSLAIQGLRDELDTGPLSRDLTVALPLTVAQNVGYLAARLSGGSEAAGRVAWIRGAGDFSRTCLWGIWLLAAAAAAWFAASIRPRGWGLIAGLATATVPVGLVGTERLEAWALAIPFALATRLGRRGLVGVLIWGALLSLTPLGFVLAGVGLIASGRGGRIGIVWAVPLWFALDPARIVSPGLSVTGLIDRFEVAGWPGFGDGAPLRLLYASWTPGVAVAIGSVVGSVWAIRNSKWRATVLLVALLWWIPALFGAMRPDAVGLVAPFAFLLATIAGERLTERAEPWVRPMRVAIGLLFVVPLVLGTMSLRKSVRNEDERLTELASVLAAEVGTGGLIAVDPTIPMLPDSIASFPFPTHVERPEVWDFAYWPGWYGPFTHILFRARKLRDLEAASEKRPGARAMVFGLSQHADPIAVIGDPITERSALVLYSLQRGPPWEPIDRAALWDRLEGGVTEARFLTDLAAFLAENDRLERAIELLRLSLRWDPESERSWNNLGATLLLLGEPEEAAEVLQRGLTVHPSSVEIRYTLARAYLDGEVPGRAVIELRKVLSARPNFGPAHYAMARAGIALQRWSLVVGALEAYLATVPDPPNEAEIVATLAEARRRAEGGR